MGSRQSAPGEFGLSATQYSQPVLGLIFLRFAEAKFSARREALERQAKGPRKDSRPEDAPAYHSESLLYLAVPGVIRTPARAARRRGRRPGVNAAMRAIERDNTQVAGALPKTYEYADSPESRSQMCHRTLATGRWFDKPPPCLGVDASHAGHQRLLSRGARYLGHFVHTACRKSRWSIRA